MSQELNWDSLSDQDLREFLEVNNELVPTDITDDLLQRTFEKGRFITPEVKELALKKYYEDRITDVYQEHINKRTPYNDLPITLQSEDYLIIAAKSYLGDIVRYSYLYNETPRVLESLHKVIDSFDPDLVKVEKWYSSATRDYNNLLIYHIVTELLQKRKYSLSKLTATQGVEIGFVPDELFNKEQIILFSISNCYLNIVNYIVLLSDDILSRNNDIIYHAFLAAAYSGNSDCIEYMMNFIEDENEMTSYDDLFYKSLLYIIESSNEEMFKRLITKYGWLTEELDDDDRKKILELAYYQDNEYIKDKVFSFMEDTEDEVTIDLIMSGLGYGEEEEEFRDL